MSTPTGTERRMPDWLPYMLVSIIGSLVACCALYMLASQSYVALWAPIQAQISGRNCGTITDGESDAGQGELCLWHAYTVCQNAALVDTFQIQQTHGSFTLTIQRHGTTCQVHFTGVWTGPIPILSTVAEQATCTGMRQEDGGLTVLGCGAQGDVYLNPLVCGRLRKLDNGYTDAAANALGHQFGNCFWQAYTTCAQTANLYYAINVYDKAKNLVSAQNHLFTVQSEHGSCILTDDPTGYSLSDSSTSPYTCVSLTRDATQNLIAHHCGAEGDITISVDDGYYPEIL